MNASHRLVGDFIACNRKGKAQQITTKMASQKKAEREISSDNDGAEISKLNVLQLVSINHRLCM